MNSNNSQIIETDIKQIKYQLFLSSKESNFKQFINEHFFIADIKMKYLIKQMDLKIYSGLEKQVKQTKMNIIKNNISEITLF